MLTTAATALVLWVGAAPAYLPAPPEGAAQHLARMELSLTDDEPYRFLLRYRGPMMPFRGDVCYGFAGYNETCTHPRLEWLTPATTIELYAPGGVPRELLEGYVMLVRFPAMAEPTYRFRLGAGDNGNR